MQYKIRKPITIASLMAKGGSDHCFRKNLNLFMNMEKWSESIDLWEKISINDIVPCFRYYPIWEDWLVEKGFIEAERTYSIGQYFTHEEFPNCVMSISRISNNIVNVIAHNFSSTYADSNRLTMNGIQVDDPKVITTAEMCKMTSWGNKELRKIRFCNIAISPLEVK